MNKNNIMTQLQKEFDQLPNFAKKLNIHIATEAVVFPQHFTLYQKRILGYCLSLISKEDRNKTEEEFINKTFAVHVKHFAKVFNLTHKSLYEEMKSAVDDLFSEITTIKNKKTQEELKFVWCQQAVYKKEEGLIYIKFSELVAQYLINLGKQKNYTSYSLFLSHSLKKTHSIRIYELLQTRKDTNTLYMSFVDFCNALALSKSYKNPSSIKAKILEDVKKELNSRLDLGFDYSFIRNKSYDGNYLVVLKAKRNNDNIIRQLMQNNKFNYENDLEITTTNKKKKSKTTEYVFNNSEIEIITDSSEIPF